MRWFFKSRCALRPTQALRVMYTFSQVCSTTTSAEVIPDLVARFHPEGQGISGGLPGDSMAGGSRQLRNYIALMQGESECTLLLLHILYVSSNRVLT